MSFLFEQGPFWQALVIAAMCWLIGWCQGATHELERHNKWLDKHIEWLRSLVGDGGQS